MIKDEVSTNVGTQTMAPEEAAFPFSGPFPTPFPWPLHHLYDRIHICFDTEVSNLPTLSAPKPYSKHIHA